MINMDKIPKVWMTGYCFIRIFHLRPLVEESNAEFEAMKKERDHYKHLQNSAKITPHGLLIKKGSFELEP